MPAKLVFFDLKSALLSLLLLGCKSRAESSVYKLFDIQGYDWLSQGKL
jgi:hypothetical protein